MFKLKMESDELRKLFLAYLCGGNRPLHEVLFPLEGVRARARNNPFTIKLSILQMVDRANCAVLRVDWKVISVFPQEGKRFKDKSL
jgi:hypothetical protein